MTNVPMPEPAAWAVTVGENFANCIEITHCKEDAEAQYEASTEGGYESLYMLRELITTTQAEAYKDACVREALEEAAGIADREHFGGQHDDDLSWTGCAAHIAHAIRSLLPPTE